MQMSLSGEVINPNERVQLCQRLMPRIIQATKAFFDPEQPHPYLEGLAKGGYLYELPEEETDDAQSYRTVEALGFRDTLMPEEYPKIGIPEEVAKYGLMWVVMTSKIALAKDSRVMPAQQGKSKEDHCFTYWDGEHWHAARIKDSRARPATEWSSQWKESEPSTQELEVIKSVAIQTQDVHEIARVFNGSDFDFENMILDFPRDELSLRILARGLTSAFNTARYGGNMMPSALRTYMRFFTTGYQSFDLIRTAHKLQNHRSFELDSGGIMNANYHRGSLPSTPEMLKNGENILFSNMHPPVPIDFI